MYILIINRASLAIDGAIDIGWNQLHHFVKELETGMRTLFGD